MNAFALGAFASALAVALGAFGAHALSGIGAQRLGWWTTATQYQFIAAVGMLAHGLRATGTSPGPTVAFLAAIVLFSGSLYGMALGAPRWFGAITPLGGLSLILGFCWLGVLALRH